MVGTTFFSLGTGSTTPEVVGIREVFGWCRCSRRNTHRPPLPEVSATDSFALRDELFQAWYGSMFDPENWWWKIVKKLNMTRFVVPGGIENAGTFCHVFPRCYRNFEPTHHISNIKKIDTPNTKTQPAVSQTLTMTIHWEFPTFSDMCLNGCLFLPTKLNHQVKKIKGWNLPCFHDEILLFRTAFAAELFGSNQWHSFSVFRFSTKSLGRRELSFLTHIKSLEYINNEDIFGLSQFWERDLTLQLY